VVGAGFAGLSAAFQLVQQGHRVTVLERASRAGGRAAAGESDRDPIAARVSTADHALHALVRAAGLAREFLPVRPVRSAFARGGHFVPIPPGADPSAVARIPGVRFLDALRLVRLPRLLARYRANLDPGAPERAAAHDDRSLADFGTLYFGRSVVTAWMEPWLAERAPVDEREASRAAFLMRFAAERDAVAGSLAAPVGRLAAALAARLEVRTGAAVLRVEAGTDRGLRVALAAETIDADAVVLAVPAPEAERIGDAVLVAAERTLLAGVRYDAAITWSAPMRVDASLAPARVRIEKRGTSPFASVAVEGGVVTAVARDPWVRARADWPDDALAKEIAAEVERTLPGVVAGGGVVRRFPLAWPRFDVGHYRALAQFRAVEADRAAAGRPLFFAGDWLAAPTLEGAVVSGRRLAATAARLR
jgi:protoporphyrinogen oxidase